MRPVLRTHLGTLPYASRIESSPSCFPLRLQDIFGVCLVFIPLLYYKQHAFPLPKLFAYCPSQCNYRASQPVSTPSCGAHATTQFSAPQVKMQHFEASSVPWTIVASVINIRRSSIRAISRHERFMRTRSPTKPAVLQDLLHQRDPCRGQQLAAKHHLTR